MKRLLQILILGVCLLMLPMALAEHKPLKVGVELHYPPFEYANDKGEPAGLSVDFIRDFAEYANREIVFEVLSWDSMLPSLQIGKVDMLISSLSITPGRREIADFSVPYAYDMVAGLCAADSSLLTYEDIRKPGIRIAVKTSSIAYYYVKEHFPEANIVSFYDDADTLNEFLQGRADIYLSDQMSIYRLQQEHGDKTRIIALPEKDALPWAVAFRKGNEELVDLMNEFIEVYAVSGGFDILSDTYLNEEKSAFKELGFHWYFDKILRIE